jgi:hypothetical protein
MAPAETVRNRVHELSVIPGDLFPCRDAIVGNCVVTRHKTKSMPSCHGWATTSLLVVVDIISTTRAQKEFRAWQNCFSLPLHTCSRPSTRLFANGSACEPIGPRSGLVVVVGISGDAIFELTFCFPERARQLGELCSAEEDEQDHEDDNQLAASETSHPESVAGSENTNRALEMT